MDDSAWAQRDKEPSKWHERFLIYLRLGPERSLHAAYVQYRAHHDEVVKDRYSVPKSWKTNFEKWDWEERAKAKDTAERAEADAAYAKRRTEILESGYALDFERVAKLKDLADLLWNELSADTKRWLPDVKGIGSGDKFEKVDIVRFNTPLVEQFRATLDDLAKERGERKQNVKLDAEVTHFEVTSDKMAKAKKRAAEYEKKLADAPGAS